MKIRLMILALVVAAAPAAAQPEPTPGELAAANELLEVSRSRENFIRGMEIGMEMGGMGELTPEVRAAVREVLDQHFPYEELQPDMARMYADLYTEEEIRGMIAFYRTPLGQRMIETLPELTAESQRIVQERLQAVMPVLVQRITEVLEAQEEAPTTTPRR
ncbi:DUF2059 domain-containing protein [Longimicrobium sp.]|uniref:DUF2059 domain-containing protein n=1 Tax=Longimicrobium sp. TaxID=2029185 RepID=UPI003B3A2EF8